MISGAANNRKSVKRFGIVKRSRSDPRGNSGMRYDSSMPKAIWEGAILADSDKCVVVEGNQYFPADSIAREYFKPSTTTTTCPWKGKAHYYSLDVNGKLNPDAAWFYPEPSKAATQIKDRVAFWRGVKVE